MQHPDRTIAAILEKYGFAIVRTRGKHAIARNAAGAQVVVSKTPSDHRAYRNIDAQCRRLTRRDNAV